MFALKVSPLSLINMNTPTTMVGIEIWFLKELSIQLEYGIPANYENTSGRNSNKLDWQYNRYKGGMRYYLYRKARIRSYVGFDLIYVPQNYTKENDFVRLEDGRMFNYASSRIERDFFSTILSTGVQLISKDRIMLELYGGIGSKKRKIKHDMDFNGATMLAEMPFQEWVSNPDRYEGTEFFPHFDLGFKIGYLFVKRR